MAFEKIVKPYIAALTPYKPGKPIEEVERELGIAQAIKLASNENPLGPSPKALAALRGAIDTISRYPDGGSFRLRTKLATILGVAGEQLVFGAGCDEILELLAKVFLGPGDEVVYGWPSFAMYPVVVQGMGATPVPVPLTQDLVYDLDALLAAVTPRTRLVFVCNPNNPTGTSVGAEAFDRFAKALPPNVVLGIDEAYFEYVQRKDFPNALDWVQRRPGTVVLRTFSKIYGLAGLRVGYGVMDAELAGYLERARHPFNVNLLAQVAACAALDDDEHVTRSRDINSRGVAYLARELAQMRLRTWPTDANFLLVDTGAKPGVCDALLRRGIIVRPMDAFGFRGAIRITIGLPEENERFIKELREIWETPK